MNETDLLRVSRKLWRRGFPMKQATALVKAVRARLEEDRPAPRTGRKPEDRG